MTVPSLVAVMLTALGGQPPALGAPSSHEIPWERDIGAAMKRAKAAGRPVLVHEEGLSIVRGRRSPER